MSVFSPMSALRSSATPCPSLPRRWQRLLEMLMADPPASYAEISDQLGLPVGSIGPTRGRCLARLRVLLQASPRLTEA